MIEKKVIARADDCTAGNTTVASVGKALQYHRKSISDDASGMSGVVGVAGWVVQAIHRSFLEFL